VQPRRRLACTRKNTEEIGAALCHTLVHATPDFAVTLPDHAPDDSPGRLQPAGRRWGRGARSVVPYLYVSLLSRPLGTEPGQDGHFIRNPVFPHMETTLRVLRGN
jgi:hypothetical protein